MYRGFELQTLYLKNYTCYPDKNFMLVLRVNLEKKTEKLELYGEV